MLSKQTDPHFKVRMPLSIRDWIENQAQQNNRSMTAEINFRLEEAMKAQAAKATTGELSRA